jgi:hypothetical protein
VAEFASTNGNAIVAKNYGTSAKQAVKGLAVTSDATSGAPTAIAVTGNLKGTVSFIAGSPLAAQGMDGFVAKLNPADLSTAWAKRWGDSDDQEAKGVAFTSVGAVVVAGYMNGTVDNLGKASMTSAGVSDAYWAKFNSDGTNVCAAIYGEANNGQSADVLAIANAATNGQKDMVTIGGSATGTFNFSPGITYSSNAQNSFVLKLNP